MFTGNNSETLHPKIQQTKMLVMCQRLFLFGHPTHIFGAMVTAQNMYLSEMYLETTKVPSAKLKLKV